MKEGFARSFLIKEADDGADFVGGEENEDIFVHVATGGD